MLEYGIHGSIDTTAEKPRNIDMLKKSLRNLRTRRTLEKPMERVIEKLTKI